MARKRSKSNIIYVDFASAKTLQSPRREDDGAPEESATDLFSAGKAARLSGLTMYQLRSLDRAGIASPSGTLRKRRAYTFHDLVVLRTIGGLLVRRVRNRDVATVVKALRAALPQVARPLAELRIVSDGRQIVVRDGQRAFEPLTGQLLIDFDVRALQEDVIRSLRSERRSARSSEAYELYVRASALDENPSTLAQAEALYRQAVQLDPWLAMAHTNLGNVKFRQGHTDAAVVHYERALALDPEQPEAHYNLGYVLLERGDAAAAVTYLERAVRGDGSFPDAFFYLAMAYEGVEQHEAAAPHWRRYLELAPQGTWADIARRHCMS